LGPSSVTDELVKIELDSDGEGVPGAELEDADSEDVDEEARVDVTDEVDADAVMNANIEADVDIGTEDVDMEDVDIKAGVDVADDVGGDTVMDPNVDADADIDIVDVEVTALKSISGSFQWMDRQKTYQILSPLPFVLQSKKRIQSQQPRR
jgi:hypothetical protein